MDSTEQALREELSVCTDPQRRRAIAYELVRLQQSRVLERSFRLPNDIARTAGLDMVPEPDDERDRR